ncbi:MAG: hypothetical protein H6574_10845 [Lewinellaceae bacterium]|nr:hypothetical protein [Saprospiraceae bacterium]MCB9331572.1 hypothetical protein [Lewinellaceae bacterium]
MSKVSQNFAQYLRSLQIVFGALVAGQVITLTIFYVLPQASGTALPGEGLAIRIPIVILLLLPAAFFLGRNRIEAARNLPTLKEKMMAYRTALVLRWALLEGSGLLAAVFFFLSRNTLLLAVAGVIILVFMLFVPSRERTISDLDLSTTEQAALDDPNEIVADIQQRGF